MIHILHTDEYMHNQFVERHPAGGFDVDDGMGKDEASDGKGLSLRCDCGR